MKKSLIMVLILVILAMAVGVLSAKTANDLAGDTLRLHIIANSDSEADQNLKLKLRDELLPVIKSITDGAASKNEAEKKLSDSVKELETFSQERLNALGSRYSVCISVGERYFPTKTYGAYALPAGEYPAVTVTIGNGGGKNFWCLIYPEAYEGAVEEIDESDLSDEEKDLIKCEKGGYVIRFRIVELFGKVKQWLLGEK